MNNLEKKVISLEVNLEVTGIPDDDEDQNLEEKVIEILDKIDVNV